MTSVIFISLKGRRVYCTLVFFFFLSSSLVAKANSEEVECPAFEPRPLHIICNILVN